MTMIQISTPSASVRGTLLLTIAALGVAGCSPSGDKPTGQVVAVAGGTEITFAEVQAELAAAGIGAPTPAMRAQALEMVIRRKLLANAARREKLDLDPQFILARQRGEESLLAQDYLAQGNAIKGRTPSAADIKAFIRANPFMGPERAIISLDQIAFEQKGKVPEAIDTALSLDAVDAYLDRSKIRNQRGRRALDTATIPVQLIGKLKSLAPGQPLTVAIAPGSAAAMAVLRWTPRPSSAKEAEELAKAAILGSLRANIAKSLRDGAVVTYAKGYDPAAKPD